ncbi:hypothetical protein FBR02_11955 [Anaerolineae bacterium CFX9]|nr:hypothetical protein [Anaerolineae bacterium CFX9]
MVRNGICDGKKRVTPTLIL